MPDGTRPLGLLEALAALPRQSGLVGEMASNAPPHTAEMRSYAPTWRDSIAALLMGDSRASPERRAFVSGLMGSTGLGSTGFGLVDATPLGAPLAAQEAAKAGDWQGAALAVAPFGAATRVAAKPSVRALKQGYDADLFYRGEADGALPREYPGGGYFSRDIKTAGGFAKRGGAEAPREFRLNLQNAFADYKPVTGDMYLRLIRSAESVDPTTARNLVDLIAPPGMSAKQLTDILVANPGMTVAESGAHLRPVIEQSRAPEKLWLGAGFDALDSGRDVRKLGGAGIRLRDAEFDPARANELDIMSALSAGAFA